METVIENTQQIGELATHWRNEVGIRQEDLHGYTKLGKRFIGEVEHGKQTAQIGKVIEMLSGLGLELAIRPKTIKEKTNPHALGLSKSRFWSSGKELPIERIIARVLADPTIEDIRVLVRQFGIGQVLTTWQKLKSRGEVSEYVIPITTEMLRKIALD